MRGNIALITQKQLINESVISCLLFYKMYRIIALNRKKFKEFSCGLSSVRV